MQTYWKYIKPIPGFKGAVLRLHLLTGGLRIQQLVSLKSVNIRGDEITLFDTKGRPGNEPRPYTTPLLPLAMQALKDCNCAGEYALSTNNGQTHLAATTLSVGRVMQLAIEFQTLMQKEFAVAQKICSQNINSIKKYVAFVIAWCQRYSKP
jgi:hypothetical protein